MTLATPYRRVPLKGPTRSGFRTESDGEDTVSRSLVVIASCLCAFLGDIVMRMRPGPAVVLLLVVLGASSESADDRAWRECMTVNFGQPPPADLPEFTKNSMGCPGSAAAQDYSSSSPALSPITM